RRAFSGRRFSQRARAPFTERTKSGPRRRNGPKPAAARQAAVPRIQPSEVRPMARLDNASPEELGAIRSLLESAGLPTSDLESWGLKYTVVRDDGQVAAAGALQRFGSSALLRSVVVAEDRRGSGLGQMIVCELERLATAAQITELILLTQTAAEFFARQGYRAIERTSAPQDMQTSEEFHSLCPSSATCMAKTLPDSS